MKQLCDFFYCAFGTKLILFSISFFCLTVEAQNATANTAKPSVKKPSERKTNLNFEDELVEGATQKPELFYLFQQKNFNYKRLIKLRENFRPEMRKTTEDIQRIRSEN
jgi:hypothetical protein